MKKTVLMTILDNGQAQMQASADITPLELLRLLHAAFGVAVELLLKTPTGLISKEGNPILKGAKNVKNQN